MNQRRNYGIDLLRIIATFMVIILHVLGVGGVIYNIDSSSPIYNVAWLLEFLSYCAVNCYVLISGYVGINSKFRISSILHLWLQVVFTALSIVLGFGLALGEIDVFAVGEACIPIISELYWYFTAYACLYFVMPFLNELIIKLNYKMSKCLLGVLFVLFIIVPTFSTRDLFYVNYGYSPAWFVVLYLTGGIIAKYFTRIQVKKKMLFAGYIVAVLVTFFVKIGIEYMNELDIALVYESNFLMSYNSPTIVMAALCLLLLFANIRVEKFEKPIRFFAPLTFGIYIIHTHPIILEHYIIERFNSFTNYSPSVFVLKTLLAAIVIFVVCALVDWIRMLLFRLARIPKFCKYVENRCAVLFERVIKNDKEIDG